MDDSANADRHQRLMDLFEMAVDADESQRAALLDAACAGDPELRREIDLLLAEDAARTDLPGLPLGEPKGLRIGHYQLLQKLGEGGMGEVWMAEQKEPIRRRVALKLVKSGMNSREVLARFESERQALALMDHPAIAKVFDAGSTDNGAPYFVMEYVAGIPITAYCDGHRLSTRERLELFMRVCEGVQHAHQKAIIHRDLKPSNILVTELDGRPAPKIIDFGVSKALGQKLTADTIFTRAGVLVGTPEYMSPEQARSPGEGVDTRTDIYSLGIIFYELLAGAPPVELRKVALEEFLRRLREDEPPKPSTKVRTQDPATSTEIARNRQTEPLLLMRQIQGDLDSIALKALEKQRPRRYGTPFEFAADIERYLNNEPVQAVPPSAAYRARKFARRYRVALATVLTFAIVLVTAAVISIRQSMRASREAATAQAVIDFLQNDLLAQANLYTQSRPDPDFKVRTALDRASARIGGKFDKQPEVEAVLRATMADAYYHLGLYQEARVHDERTLDLEKRMWGADSPDVLKTLRRLAADAERQGRFADEEEILSRVVPIDRRVFGPNHPETLLAMANLAAAYGWRGKEAQAEELGKQVLEIQRRVLGPEHRDTLWTMNNLAQRYAKRGEFVEEEPLQSELVETRRRLLGPENFDTLWSMNALAATYDAEGKLAQAEALYNQTLEIRRRVLGAEHPETLRTMSNLAITYSKGGNNIAAEALAREAMEIRRRTLGPAHHDTLRSVSNLAFIYQNEGKFAEAEPFYAEAAKGQRQVFGVDDPVTLESLEGLAWVCAMQGKYAQAESLYNEALVAHRRVASRRANMLSNLMSLAFVYQIWGRYSQAEANAAEALAARRQDPGPEFTETIEAAADLALAYVSQKRFAVAEPLAREAVDFYQKHQPEDWQRFRAQSLLGASLAGQKKFLEAEPLLLGGYQGMMARQQKMATPDRYHLDRAHEWTVDLYRSWGKPDKAAEWSKK